MVGPFDHVALLDDSETWWRDHYLWLEQHGYTLRPRYHPEWKPSWLGSDIHPLAREDGQYAVTAGAIMDATRKSDGTRVMLKRTYRSRNPFEIDVARFLCSKELSADPRNHCCPIHEVFQVPDDDDIQVFVMPFLREYNDPPMETVGEAIEFFRQILECLHFMHDNHVAHRDCMTLNVMMDAEPIYPEGYHPITGFDRPAFDGTAKVLSRTVAPVKYYLIDFGLSCRFSPDDPNPLEIPSMGGDRTVPELRHDDDTPRNPFPTDIYYIGNLIREDFLNYYTNLEFMRPLIDSMVVADPSARPTMTTVVAQFHELRPNLSQWKLRSRLVRRKDSGVANFLKNVRHVFRTVALLARRASAVPIYRE